MLSYIVGFIAIVIFVGNPLMEMLSPGRTAPNVSPRPRLNESLLAVDAPNATAPDCPADAYGVRILSREPLVVYVEGFLSEGERKHLLEISDPLFEPSTITHGATSSRDATIRNSHVALLPRTNAVRCIEARAHALQGLRREVWLERLRTQRYGPGGHYSHHFDWGSNAGGWGRVGSMMAWVDGADVVGGGTEFPLLRREDDDEGEGQWCQFVECGSAARGVTFKVVPGNAVYWENFAPGGRGYEETWHAGLPVERGVKVGLNIWSFGRIR